MQTHRWILGGPLLALAAGTALAQCPNRLVERYIPADCEACWRDAAVPPAGSAVLDWIVPSARGDAAPLAAAALAAATARAPRSAPDATLERRHALAARGVDVRVEDGPILNGYLGVRLTVRHDGRGSLPEGAVGYIALVEALAPGEEGSPVERRLVRQLAGPLTLDPMRKDVEHLLAVRIAVGTRIDGLAVIGWVETPSRRILAAAARSAGCGPIE
ncbi:MAG: hypothetical protein IPG91_15715 [Ideonella sp.]|nr:hypothetical protein [Ideonella sp.]